MAHSKNIIGEKGNQQSIHNSLFWRKKLEALNSDFATFQTDYAKQLSFFVLFLKHREGAKSKVFYQLIVRACMRAMKDYDEYKMKKIEFRTIFSIYTFSL